MNTAQQHDREQEILRENVLFNMKELARIIQNPEWGFSSKPRFMRETLELLIDVLTAGVSMNKMPVEKLNGEMANSDQIDSLGNNRILKVNPRLDKEIADEFAFRIGQLFEDMLHTLCLVHQDLIHTQGQAFSKASEEMLFKYRKDSALLSTGYLPPVENLGTKHNIKQQYAQHQKKARFLLETKPSSIVKKLIEERELSQGERYYTVGRTQYYNCGIGHFEDEDSEMD